LVANRIEKDQDTPTPARAWFVGLIAWAVPGAGHFMQGRWLRGALAGGAVWAMFFIGLWLGGHMYALGGGQQSFGAVLQLLPMIANVGMGLPYFVCWIAQVGFTEHAQLVTYEYGNTFLLVAGLLNYLVMLDAFDIAAGRKR
jgi:hypothetical protein